MHPDGGRPQGPPWRGGIRLLNRNRENKRAGSVIALPAHAISTKNKHLLVIYSIPTRGFTAAVSVFWGTPPPKPLKCKSVSNCLGALNSDLWAEPIGGEPRLSCAILSVVVIDIIKTSLSFCSQCFAFHYRIRIFVNLSGKIKNPASFLVSRVGKSLSGSFTRLP